MAKKLKDVVKQNPEPARGTNYKDPGQLGQYSATNQVAEDSSLSQYLKSRGINAEVLSKDSKISHAKSNTFKKWRNDHKFESVELEESASLDQYLKSRGINSATLPTDKKIAIAKSTAFIVWKNQHIHESKTVQGTALDKFRVASAERAKKHDEIEKNRSKDGSGMSSAIDRLQKHMNKEETELDEDKMLPPIHKKVMSKAGNHIGTVYKYDKPNVLGYTHGASYHPHGGRGGASGVEWTHHNDPETAEKTLHRPHGLYKAAATKAVQKAEKHKASIPEETELDEMDQKFVDSLNKLSHTHKVGDSVTVDSKFFGKQKGKVIKVDNQSVHVQRDGKKYSEKYPHGAVVKEEVEQIDEISKSTLASYKDKSTTSLKNAQANRDAAEPGKHMSKGFADLHAKSDAIAKKRVKGLKGYLQRKVGMKPVSEDNFADPQAATQSCFDGANNTDDTHEVLNRKRGLSKSARMIKALYKHHGIKEEIYDHEKDDKNQTSLGKKSPKVPTLSKEDPNALPNGEPKARAVMSGGKTLTGEPRDMVEIDPQMKSRPDLNGNKKDDEIVNKKLDK